MTSRAPLGGFAASGGLKDLLSSSSKPLIPKSLHSVSGDDLKHDPDSRTRESIPRKGATSGTSTPQLTQTSKTQERSACVHETESIQKQVEKKDKQPEQAERLKALGNAAFAEKDFSAAIEYYSQAISHDSENGVLYANRAQALLNQGRIVRALDDANHAVSLNPGWWKAHAKLAQACLGLGLGKPAADAFEEALELQPDDAALRKGLAEAKAGLRRWESMTNLSGISYPGWEEIRADVFGTIDIDKQVNVSLPGSGGKTVSRKTGLNYLHQAVIGGDLPLVVDLARLGAGLNLKTSAGFPRTPLFLAITARARADANPSNPVELARRIPTLKGEPLSEALEVHYHTSGKGARAQFDVAEYLLSLGADIEAKSDENDPLFPGMSPLAAAAQQRDWATCDLLLKFGADPKATVSGGHSAGRTIENLVSGDDPNRSPESASCLAELEAGLSVVDLHKQPGKPTRVKRVTRADLDQEREERVSRFKGLVAKYAGEPRPPVLCRCGSRVPVLECHGRGLEGLESGAVLRRLSPGAPCPCQRPGATYWDCCWKSQDWVLDDDTGAILSILRPTA